MYTGQKDIFNRSAEARRSKKRQELRNLTKMSDEQLEGWAIMFGRNVCGHQLLSLRVAVNMSSFVFLISC